MYQSLLTRRYLFSKVMPLLASVAVILCTAMVLITWSVMGGFLNMLINTRRTMTGDVVITWPNTGFAHYQDLIDRLKKEPAVAAAAPMIEAYGLVGLPDGRNETVVIRGVDGPSYAAVTRYADILWWRPLEEPLPKDTMGNDPRVKNLGGLAWGQVYENGMSLTRKDEETGEVKPGVVLGVEVTGFNYREIGGFYTPRVVNRRTAEGEFEEVDVFMPRDGEVTLNVLPLDKKGRVVETVTRILPVANEFQSGVYEMDERTVLVNLDTLQTMLKMNRGKRVAKEAKAATPPTGESFGAEPVLEDDPERVTHVLVKGVGDMAEPGDADRLKFKCEQVYAQFAAAHKGEVPDEWSIRIMTWEDQNRTMINAVRKETALVLFIFSFISLTAVFLVLAIFWSMVAEKTRDIGVLRAIGASRAGVAWLWVRYGLAIGVVGSILGGATAYAIVLNINPIHEWLGQALGIVIWDPRIYYFVTIPNKVETDKAIIVMTGGVLSCALGALWPATRAAFMDPVRALRFE
jgi:lipoprotein-releasing system permease protein